LALTVVIGVFLATVVINFGGFVDKIYRDRIDWALAYMSMDMREMSVEQRDLALDQARWQMEEAAGLHQPFLLRCVRWLGQGLTFQLGDASGVATPNQEPLAVLRPILERLPNTLLLAGTANLLLFFLTLFVALVLSRKYGTWLDRVMVTLSPISSVPNWVYGIILTVLFAAQLRILPYGGMFDDMPPQTKFGYVFVVLKHMILPVTAIFLSMFFQSVYVWRTFFLLHAGEDYVEMAEAKGLSARMVEQRYILRPTLPYILTSFALMVIGFWQGTMALEIFFGWPGIGALFVQSVWRLDRPTVLSLIVLFAYLLALSVFLLDIFYALVDPRVRLGAGGQTVRRPWRKRRPRLWRRPTLPILWMRVEQASERRTRERAPGAGRILGDWVRGVGETRRRLWVTLGEIARYPSAVVGLAIILLLIGVSVYTVVTIPYSEAIRLWQADRGNVYRNPKNAQPTWVNLFRRHDLPGTIILDSRGALATPAAPVLPGDVAGMKGKVSKHAEAVSGEMSEVTLSFTFDYRYRGFPQDMALYLSSHYRARKPMVALAWLTPDGREIELGQFSITSAHSYLVSTDTRLRRRNLLGGEGGQPIEKLFAAPGATADPASESPVPLQGTYELRVTGFLFEEGANLDAEFVLYGQVFGLAGTDHQRRDLSVALLWGVPVALVFGLLGAVCTSLLSLTISAVGVWLGGWADGLVQRITEVNLILPALPIAITVYLVYAKSVWVILGVMVVLSIFGSAAKGYRAMFLQVKEAPYIEAARVYGASNRRIVFRYLVPRITPVLIPQLVILIPGYVFLEATLAYLGVSDLYLPTWGKVIKDALTHNVLQGHYYWVLEPVALLLLTGLAFAMVGFSLDRVFNPRLRTR